MRAGTESNRKNYRLERKERIRLTHCRVPISKDFIAMKSNYRNKPKGYKCFVTPAVSEVHFCIFFPLENISIPLVEKMYFGVLFYFLNLPIGMVQTCYLMRYSWSDGLFCNFKRQIQPKLRRSDDQIFTKL